MPFINRKTGEIRDRIGSKGYREWSQISSSRVKEIETSKAIQRAKAQYAPGGGFGKGVEAGLERGRVKAMASGMQHLVGAGLAGTTMAGTLGKRYEEEVGVPTRASVEEQRAQALSGIEMAEAGIGFQASQAGLQRQFQAGQAGAQRDLQRYIADLQASLQREQTAFRGPTAQPYAQQFPSVYGQGGGPTAPPMPGGGGYTPPQPSRLPEVTPAELATAFPMGGPTAPRSWTPGPTGISPAAGYYAGVPQTVGDIKFW